MKVQPYLYFAGDCEEAFKFYAETLKVPIQIMVPYEAMPESTPEMAKKIKYGSLRVGEMLLMGMDAPPDRYSKPSGFSVSLHVETADEAERIYAAMSPGGNVVAPIAETFWAHRFAMFSDRFGIPWMVGCDKPMP